MQQVTSVDRGWAWVVLVTVFLSNVLSCVNYMCGLFAIHFANTFNQPASVIAITGALANGTFCFSGECRFDGIWWEDGHGGSWMVC